MPHTKMEDYAEAEGFCCPWALLVSRKKWHTSAMTEDSGMSSRAIRYWRSRARKKELSCAGCNGCLADKIRAETGIRAPRKIP